MTDLVDFAAALVDLNGGQIIGKTRFQKLVYLLEAKGLGFGVGFDYHNYGPFSADLAYAIDDAVSLGFLDTEERRGYHEIPYTVYRSAPGGPRFPDTQETRLIAQTIEEMRDYSALELELAATACFLKESGFKDYWSEVKKRKPSKAVPQLLERSKALLRRLSLA